MRTDLLPRVHQGGHDQARADADGEDLEEEPAGEAFKVDDRLPEGVPRASGLFTGHIENLRLSPNGSAVSDTLFAFNGEVTYGPPTGRSGSRAPSGASASTSTGRRSGRRQGLLLAGGQLKQLDSVVVGIPDEAQPRAPPYAVRGLLGLDPLLLQKLSVD